MISKKKKIDGHASSQKQVKGAGLVHVLTNNIMFTSLSIEKSLFRSNILDLE